MFTILDLPYACLEVVQRQVTDLVFETVEVHLETRKQCSGEQKKGGSENIARNLPVILVQSPRPRNAKKWETRG